MATIDEDAMPAIVEIPPEQVEALDRIAAREHMSREALVQSLIAEFVSRHGSASDLGRFFGSWGDRPIDGLELQSRLRAEW